MAEELPNDWTIHPWDQMSGPDDVWVAIDKDDDLVVELGAPWEGRVAVYIPMPALVAFLRARGYTVTKDQAPCGRDDCPSLVPK